MTFSVADPNVGLGGGGGGGGELQIWSIHIFPCCEYGQNFLLVDLRTLLL